VRAREDESVNLNLKREFWNGNTSLELQKEAAVTIGATEGAMA